MSVASYMPCLHQSCLCINFLFQSSMSKFLKVVDNKRKQPDDDDASHQEKKKIKLIQIETDTTKAHNSIVRPILKKENNPFKSGGLVEMIKSTSGPSRNDKTVAAVSKLDSGAEVPDFALRDSENPPETLNDDTSEKSKGALSSVCCIGSNLKSIPMQLNTKIGIGRLFFNGNMNLYPVK